MRSKKQIKSVGSSILLIIIAFIGLSLLLYPSFSNYVNTLHQTKAITAYVTDVSSISEEEYTALWNDAEEYNRNIAGRMNPYLLTEKERMEYYEKLNITGTGIMGYIEIPAIEVSLPIYHGTSDTVLQTSVGHLEWTSLPIGGVSNHCVLSGHRGLPSAKLFTHLDKLIVGDTFILTVLNEVLTYEVDQILIVEPKDTAALSIVEGQDYCTLVTCTPYGINTHRLLVRGHRIDNSEEAVKINVTADGILIEPLIVAPILAIPTLILAFIVVLLFDTRRKHLILEDENDII